MVLASAGSLHACQAGSLLPKVESAQELYREYSFTIFEQPGFAVGYSVTTAGLENSLANPRGLRFTACHYRIAAPSTSRQVVPKSAAQSMTREAGGRAYWRPSMFETSVRVRPLLRVYEY